LRMRLWRNCTAFCDMTRPSIGSDPGGSYKFGATTIAVDTSQDRIASHTHTHTCVYIDR
jgi:hypothetical protein